MFVWIRIGSDSNASDQRGPAVGIFRYAYRLAGE
jgi:hypothetical protein